MERYYYDQRRMSRHGSGRGRRTLGFLFPFVLLIIFGVIIVFGVKLFVSFYGGAGGDGVFMYVVDGQAQVKMWGTEEFTKAYSGTRVLQGDELYTAKDSNVVVEFFDGAVMRGAGATHVVFNEIYDDVRSTDIQLVLKEGKIWVNKTALKAQDTNFLVLTDNVLVTPTGTGTIFDVENENGVESVRVTYGSVNIDIYSQNGGTVVDHISVNEGQEVLFDKEKLEKFWKFQAPNVVSNLSNEFIESNWYVWNFQEDENPTNFHAEVEPEIASESASEPASEPAVEPVPERAVEPVVTEEEAVIELGALGVPEILEVNGEEWNDSMFENGVVAKSEPIKVKGKVIGAQKVYINGYELQRFEPKEGEEQFVYWMKEEYVNLVEGENVYEVYALAPDGTRSASAYFKVVYESGSNDPSNDPGNEPSND